jgi:hypothetical protein
MKGSRCSEKKKKPREKDGMLKKEGYFKGRGDMESEECKDERVM